MIDGFLTAPQADALFQMSQIDLGKPVLLHEFDQVANPFNVKNVLGIGL
ncbi:hypothetical protein [Methylobacterium sp.]